MKRDHPVRLRLPLVRDARGTVLGGELKRIQPHSPPRRGANVVGGVVVSYAFLKLMPLLS